MMGVLVENADAAWIPPPKKKWIRHYYLSKCGVCLLRVISLCFACENAHRGALLGRSSSRRHHCQYFLLGASCCRLAGCETRPPGQRFLWPRPAFRKVCEKTYRFSYLRRARRLATSRSLQYIFIHKCEFNLQPI
jgi:hypothetical protein